MSPVKIGAVSYLNTRPLVYGLQGRDEFELVFDLPSRLADRLAAQSLDVALVPVIEAVCNPLYTIVSNACIACRGPVHSVKLFSRVPMDQIETLALDEGSRTSAALTKIILAEKFGVQPELMKLLIAQDWRASDTDAVLVIGDRAMDPGLGDFLVSVDLGEFWNNWTQLPFVFAVWAARSVNDFGLLDQELNFARDSGLEHVDSICQDASEEYHLDLQQCKNYLTQHLHFHLGAREKQGLSLFLKYAKQYSLIEQDLELQFYDCEVTR